MSVSFGAAGKTLPIKSAVRGILSVKVSPKLKAKRLWLCGQCQAVDGEGKRLYREIKGKKFCGHPRMSKKFLRNEALDGCGCNLELKASKKAVSCPLYFW